MSNRDAQLAVPRPGQSPAIDRDLVERLYRESRAAEWNLAMAEFEAALSESVVRRFVRESPSHRESPSDDECRRYLESLHIQDFALAVACRVGSEAAWDHFVAEFRPRLYAAARAVSGQLEDAREIADSLYAELYGLEKRRGERRSLFSYFHGRSSLVTWLRSVIAQRAVDRHRQSSRLTSLDDELADELATTPNPVPADPQNERYLTLARRAVTATIAALEDTDRLRLAYYYAHGLKLAEIGRLMKEHESTVSRKLERTRKGIKAGVERLLRREHGLTDAQIQVCYDALTTDPDPVTSFGPSMVK